MNKLGLAAFAASLVIIAAPFLAQADGSCSSQIAIFSSHSAGVRSPNSGPITCLADPSQEFIDGRFINPGMDQIQVRFIQDLGVSFPTLLATLDGLGFAAREITLTRVVAIPATAANPALYAYDSAQIPLPDGALSMGCITARVLDPEGGDEPLDANSFHTVGASC